MGGVSFIQILIIKPDSAEAKMAHFRTMVLANSSKQKQSQALSCSYSFVAANLTQSVRILLLHSAATSGVHSSTRVTNYVNKYDTNSDTFHNTPIRGIWSKWRFYLFFTKQ